MAGGSSLDDVVGSTGRTTKRWSFIDQCTCLMMVQRKIRCGQPSTALASQASLMLDKGGACFICSLALFLTGRNDIFWDFDAAFHVEQLPGAAPG